MWTSSVGLDQDDPINSSESQLRLDCKLEHRKDSMQGQIPFGQPGS